MLSLETTYKKETSNEHSQGQAERQIENMPFKHCQRISRNDYVTLTIEEAVRKIFGMSHGVFPCHSSEDFNNAGLGYAESTELWDLPARYFAQTVHCHPASNYVGAFILGSAIISNDQRWDKEMYRMGVLQTIRISKSQLDAYADCARRNRCHEPNNCLGHLRVQPKRCNNEKMVLMVGPARYVSSHFADL